MIRPIFGANWKMNGSLDLGLSFMKDLRDRDLVGIKADAVLFPPFTLLAGMRDAAAEAGLALGGQDLFWEEKGAFTGEISPGMLIDAGCTWFLAGHSERRHIIGESDEIVRKKLDAGLAAGLRGVLCVGELLEERESGRAEEVIRRQMESGISGLKASPDNLVIAYEPVWAIGTGLNATPEEAQRIHLLIRQWAAEIRTAGFADELRIIYGGSVKPSNILGIMTGLDVNGALIGGASLQADSYFKIVSSV